MTDTQTVTEARRHLGKHLARLREAAGFSQAELGDRLAYSRSSVANIEAGRQQGCEDFWAAADQVTKAGGALIAEAERIKAMQAASRREATAAARRARAATATSDNAGGTAVNGMGAAVIHEAFAVVADHLGDDTAQEMDLEHLILDAYRQGHGGPLSLTLVGGYAGSGKSEFARFLCALTGWCLLDKDTLSRPLVEQLLAACGADANDRHTPTYLQKVRPFEYRGLLDAGLENLRSGISTVLTAPFLHELADAAWVTRVQNRCAQLGAALVVVWVRCDEESMQDYISFRSAARDAWKLANWGEYMSGVKVDFDPVGPHYTVDNRLNAAVALADQAREIALAMRQSNATART